MISLILRNLRLHSFLIFGFLFILILISRDEIFTPRVFAATTQKAESMQQPEFRSVLLRI